jgi:hypothetical protein
MQSSIQPGRHHRLSRRCGNGETRGSRYGSAEEPRFGATRNAVNRRTVRDPRFRATWKLVNRRSRGRVSGATRKFNPGRTGRCVIRGNSDIHQSVPEDSTYGVTRTTNRRRYRKADTRGNSGIGHSAPPKMRTSGRLGDPSPVKPEMQDEGKPKSYIGGAAGGCESHRGNSEPR